MEYDCLSKEVHGSVLTEKGLLISNKTNIKRIFKHNLYTLKKT